jgi:hypothetical protein
MMTLENVSILICPSEWPWMTMSSNLPGTSGDFASPLYLEVSIIEAC